MTREERERGYARAWYAQIKEETRATLIIAGVEWHEWDMWAMTPYFKRPGPNAHIWTPTGTENPEDFARMILDSIARAAGSAAQPA